MITEPKIPQTIFSEKKKEYKKGRIFISDISL